MAGIRDCLGVGTQVDQVEACRYWAQARARRLSESQTWLMAPPPKTSLYVCSPHPLITCYGHGSRLTPRQSAFAPLPIQDASVTSSPSASLVSVDLELTSLADANELISKYDGQIADGNKLSVTIVRRSLNERMGSASALASASSPAPSRANCSGGSRQQPATQGNSRGQELLGGPSSGLVDPSSLPLHQPWSRDPQKSRNVS